MTRARTTGPEDSLAAAAEALEDELAKLESQVREASRAPLTSRRAVEQSASKLGALAGAEERLAPLLARLTAAFAGVARRQQALSEAVTARAEAIRERRATLATLLERYERLGADAAEVNALARDAHARLGDASGASTVLDLVPITERVDALAEGARALSAAAREGQFEDLASDAHALEQALLAMRNRLKLVGERARAANPS